MQDGVTILGVETSFRVNAADGAFTVTLGDLYAEEKKDFLVKLQVCPLHFVQCMNCFHAPANLCADTLDKAASKQAKPAMILMLGALQNACDMPSACSMLPTACNLCFCSMLICDVRHHGWRWLYRDASVLLNAMGYRYIPCTCCHYHDSVVTWLWQVAAVPEPQDQQEIVTLHLRYLDLAQGSMKQKSLTAAISRPADAPGDLQVDADMQEAVNRVNTANAITSAVRAADAGSLPQ